mmetsp:Transcript_50849/g.142929  ORF Transcript_50849/g.142929 Transcript_50849/m.142929 type:complete len:217 (+) Transcript_50849:1525-2175(+)
MTRSRSLKSAAENEMDKSERFVSALKMSGSSSLATSPWRNACGHAACANRPRTVWFTKSYLPCAIGGSFSNGDSVMVFRMRRLPSSIDAWAACTFKDKPASKTSRGKECSRNILFSHPAPGKMSSSSSSDSVKPWVMTCALPSSPKDAMSSNFEVEVTARKISKTHHTLWKAMAGFAPPLSTRGTPMHWSEVNAQKKDVSLGSALTSPAKSYWSFA